MLIKEDFNDTMINLRDKVKNTYDYLKGNRTNNLGTLHDASSAEIKSNTKLYKLAQQFNKAKAPFKVQIDQMGKKLLFTFNASQVPTDLVDEFKPNGKYGKLVNFFNPKNNTVEMIFDANPSKLPKTDRALYKDAKSGGANKVVGTGESLKEDLTMTIPEPYYSEDHDEFYLKVGINGSNYDFRMKDDSPYSIDQMLNKVVKMMNYSSGTALAFMKKNMIGVKSSKMSIKESHDPFTYEEVDSKQVRDADGFLQDYTWYRRSDGLNIFLLIDKDYVDLDEVGDYESDWETENDEEAQEWFDDYEGFEDEDGSYYDESLNESVDPYDLLELKSVSYQGLKDKLTKELNKVMKSPEFGFDDDEIKEYSGVEVKEDEGQIYVSVWAEVGFDALWTIKDALDPIVAKYDKDAYFDMEDAGRLLAVISDSKLKESGNPFKSHHICKGCGKPLDQCTCEVKEEDIDLDSLEESHKLGDEVTWRGNKYVIISDEDEDDLVVLRPVDKFQDSDFDDIDSGDSSEDVFLSKFQLTESLNDEMAVKMSRDDFDKMCREGGILKGLNGRDYTEVRDSFYIGYENFDAAVNDLWHSDDDYHDREWYANLLRKYTGKVNESLNEDTQLSLFDDDMINDIEVLYMWRPEEVERILIKHGSDKNNDNWVDGLDVPAAYDEIMSTFKDKYSDYDEIDYDVAKVLGLVEESLNEGLSPEKGDRVRMDHYSKVNNGQEGTVTGRLGELCWVTWDDGTKSKEIKGYLTVIERDGKVVDESLNAPYTIDSEWVRVGLDDDSNTEVAYKRYPFLVERRYVRGNDKKVTERWMLKKYDIGRQVYLPIKTYSSKEEAMQDADNSPVFKKAKFKLPKRESATQSSSIGHHKVDSIDLLEPKEALNLDSDGKRLKKLISQLVLDSDEELRDYVSRIVDEVIEERNGGADDE